MVSYDIEKMGEREAARKLHYEAIVLQHIIYVCLQYITIYTVAFTQICFTLLSIALSFAIFDSLIDCLHQIDSFMNI